MKRVIAIILIGILSLTGCINVNNVESKEELVGFKFSYVTDINDYSKKYSITIDYSDETPNLEVLEVATGNVTEFYIYDRVNLDVFIDKIRNDQEFFRFDYNLGDTDSNRWYIQIDTDTRSYCNGAMNSYPMFWDEIWEVLIDTTDAKGKSDFGFAEPVLELSVNKKEYVEKTEKFWMSLDYPEFAGDEQYVNINEVIINSINDLPIYDEEFYSDLGMVYFYGDYTLMTMEEGIVSIKYKSTVNVKGLANPSESCFGITVNLETGELKTLADLIDYETIRNRVLSGDYIVEFGSLSLMSSEEVWEEIDDVINEADYNTYICNFYEDTIFIYIIVDGVVGSDYGILKFRK